jgi:hypothetical protein
VSKALVVQSQAAGRALAELSEIETRIAQSENITDVKNIAERADALKVYLKKVVGDVDDATLVQNEAAKVGILARRRGGELITEGQERGEIAGHGGDRKTSKVHAAPLTEVLDCKNENTAKNLALRWKLLASLTLKQIGEICKYFNDNGLELTTADCYRAAKGKAPGDEPEDRTVEACLTSAEKHAAQLVDDLIEAKELGAKVGPKLAAARALLGLFRNADKEAA